MNGGKGGRREALKGEVVTEEMRRVGRGGDIKEFRGKDRGQGEEERSREGK